MSSTSTWKMTQHSISELEKRLKAENESRNMDRTQLDISPGLGSPRHGSGRRPHMLGELRPEGTPTRQRRAMMDLALPVPCLQQPAANKDSGETESKLKEIMKMNGILNINGMKYQTDIKDLEHLGELGNGTCGHVVKMRHKPSQTVIAVKQMRRSGNTEENKRIIMDLDVVLKSHDCPYIVQCLGCFITDSDVWICMELMATCFDKLLKRLQKPVPEEMLGKVTFATVKALNYLKEVHGVIHRDVKPSNILLDERGNVKLCDFGISGRLVDSKAKTRSAGCAAYMAPERIDPPDPTKPDYDIRADVWSLGVTLVELATGVFPYRNCKTDFEVLSRVLEEAPPSLPSDQPFSRDFHDFVTSCLTKNYKQRPKYKKLLEHPFIKKHDRCANANAEMAAWFARVMHQSQANITNNNSPIRKLTPPSPSPRRPSPLRSTAHRAVSEPRAPAPAPGSSPGFEPNTPLTQDAFWRVSAPPQSRDASLVGTGFLGSPLPGRKRFPPESPPAPSPSPHHHLGNTSPLVLQRFYHQQSQHSPHHLVTYPPRAAPPPGLGGAGGEPGKGAAEAPASVGGSVRKRFSTYFKLYLGGGGGQAPAPPPRWPAEPAAGSPLRRAFLDHPARRAQADGSPALSRRYISPSPPQPPPRRVSESTSVPGSPQHPRIEHHRARFHYTPEPHRRIYDGPDFQQR